MGWKQVLVSHLVLSFRMRNNPSSRLTNPVSLVMRAVMRMKLERAPLCPSLVLCTQMTVVKCIKSAFSTSYQAFATRFLGNYHQWKTSSCCCSSMCKTGTKKILSPDFDLRRPNTPHWKEGE